MKIIEQTNTRLAFETSYSKMRFLWLGMLLAIAALLATQTVQVDGGGQFFWQLVLPIAIGAFAVYTLATMHTEKLEIDKANGLLTITNSYLFGKYSRVSSIALETIKQFIIEEFRPNSNGASSSLAFTFIGNDKIKIAIYLGKLHFGEGSNTANPAESNERALGTFISEFINVPIQEKATGLNSKSTYVRLTATAGLLIAGAVTGLIVLFLLT